MRRFLSAITRRLARFGLDARGVSAVEFALISPLLILTYMGLAELSQAMIAQRRVSHAASAIGDLVAQADAVSLSGMADIFAASSTILSPYSTSTLKMRITSITGDVNGNPKVAWSSIPSGQSGMSAYATGASVTLPTGLITTSGENVIMAEATYTYTPLVKYVVKNGLNFSEKFYLRPRKVAAIPTPS